ncbi:MAG: LacI family transcriptional regulator [Coprococcus sp.]|nr:LacI family transcriptional regulator [Coprococcus sp.]
MKNIPNIKNVAKIAQVSISTVSRVINQSVNVSDELKERVYKAIEETNYSVNPIASNLKSAKRNQIGIVIPSLRQTYFTDIIKGASDYCYQRQVTPIILESSGDMQKEERIIENLEKQWVDGIILIPSKNETVPGYLEFIRSLNFLSKQNRRIPVVLAECIGTNYCLDCVRVDYEDAFYKMTCHLLENGSRQIAYLSSPKDSPFFDISWAACLRALNSYGFMDQEDVLEDAGYTILEGYQAMRRILQKKENIDGVVCANDQVAAGALHACRESESDAARKIGIVGFGGVAISIITSPSITTMIVPRYHIGYESARRLFQRISGDNRKPEEVVLPSHMASRASTFQTECKKLDFMFDE